MTQRSTLALLIPAYNAAAFLPRLLGSARAQTEPFDEIWVYDDCSSDDTAAVAERWGAKVVRGETNRGCSAGKNVLAQTTGADWIHFHDADDELLPRFVELARRWTSDDGFDVVLFPFEERDDVTGELIDVWRFDAGELVQDARSYAIRVQINPFCGLYRKSSFLRAGGYDEDPDVLFNEDVAMHVRLAFAGLRFSADSEVCVVNRRRRNSMSDANSLKCAQAQLRVIHKTAEHPDAQPYRIELAARAWRVAGVLAAHLDWPNADLAARLASRLAPHDASGQAPLFRAASRLSPSLALRARETLIRLARPDLRQGYPKQGSRP